MLDILRQICRKLWLRSEKRWADSRTRRGACPDRRCKSVGLRLIHTEIGGRVWTTPAVDLRCIECRYLVLVYAMGNERMISRAHDHIGHRADLEAERRTGSNARVK